MRSPVGQEMLDPKTPPPVPYARSSIVPTLQSKLVTGVLRLQHSKSLGGRAPCGCEDRVVMWFIWRLLSLLVLQ